MNLVKSAEVYLQKSFVQVSESEEFLSIGFKEVNEIIGDYIMLKNGTGTYLFGIFEYLKLLVCWKLESKVITSVTKQVISVLD